LLKRFIEYIDESAKWTKLGDNLVLRDGVVAFKGNSRFVIPGKSDKHGNEQITVSAYWHNTTDGIDGKIVWNGYEAVNTYKNLNAFRRIFDGS
jgi:hypothetical protein